MDFAAKQLAGHVVLTAHSLAKESPATSLQLDCKFLEISKVESLQTDKSIEFTVEDGGQVGSVLTIPLTDADFDPASGNVRIKVHYNTLPQSSAVQWLDAEATKDKVAPFLFTQCQAIHARTLLPCQDTPTVKASYNATVRCPTNTTAIMSALGNGDKPVETHDDGTHTFAFKQPIAMSSYLVALAVGNLASKEVGPRSSVWAEPSVVDAAAYEFADTEKFLATGEKICGPYVWTRYDVLCMPPSFPYGGMENPCLTFVTPTLLAGDRSLADVVIHEITHSWTGNLVTNRTWEHFWLNEGWTMFVQRKIARALYGAGVADLDAIEGLSDLKDAVDRYGADHNFTRLIPDLSADGGIDPDDAFSTVPYEKGHALLCTIQHAVGGAEKMDPFIKAYVVRKLSRCERPRSCMSRCSCGMLTVNVIVQAKFGNPTLTLTSGEFKAFVIEYFSTQHDIDLSQKLDWDKWFFGPGMPENMRELFPDDSLLVAAVGLKDVWVSKSREPAATDVDGWTCSQTTIFLKELLEHHVQDLSVQQLTQMDSLYKLSERRNSEIRFNWQRLCIAVGKADIIPRVVEFLQEQGRMKFVRPLYRSLLSASKKHEQHSAAFRSAAVDTFDKSKTQYHPIASKMIQRDILEFQSAE